MKSGNAYSGRTLKRMELKYINTKVKFAVNPEDYTQVEPNRATITQTKGGAWIDAWGAGITEFTIKGITGVRGSDNGSIETGYNRWVELRNLFRECYDKITDGEKVSDYIQFYNYTDNEYWYCYPTQQGIELYRSKSKPHVYQYTIHLWGIRRMGTPLLAVVQTIGNPFKANGGVLNNSSNSLGLETTKNQVVKTQGGNTYYSRSRNFESDADVSTVTNTKTKSILSLQNDCKQYYTEMEPIIGGKSGKISPATGYQCSQGLIMQSSGTVSNVNSFTGKDLSPNYKDDLMLSEVKFVSKISVETYNMTVKIKEYSPDVLSTAYSLITGTTPKQRIMQAALNGKVYDSTIFDLIAKYQSKAVLSKSEVNHLKIIVLESMFVYRELYNMYNQSDGISTVLTSTELRLLLNNIRAMIIYFTMESDEEFRYYKMDISNELRTLERIITQVKMDIIDYL